MVARERRGQVPDMSLFSCSFAPLLIAFSLASCEARRTFLHESRTALVIISAVKTRLDGALDYGEIAFGLRL